MKTTIMISLFVITACGKGGDKPSNETLPKMNFADLSVNEGTGGTSQVELTLTLDHASSKPVTVSWSAIAGTATAVDDFTAVTNQTLTFQPNETEKKIAVTVVADDIKEGDEIFQVRVENPVNVILLKGTSFITLKNDDIKVGYSNTGYEAATSYPGYTLSWSDEFNGTSLNMADWSAETGDGCPGVCGWGNNELEYYTAPPNNLFFQDGKMIIEAKAESFAGKNYTSSRIITREKQSFKFGRIDIRAILPKDKGIWPAFWMMPQDNVFGNWPSSGELDLMELIGSEPSKVHGTLHFGPGPGSTMISNNYSLPTGTFNDKFHVFSTEWEQGEIRWYVDDILYATVENGDLAPNNYPFNEKFFFIINLAVGGNWPGNPEANTVFPKWLIVDYVRIYQK